MKPKERQAEILAILRAMQKEIQVDKLSNILGVSPLTIRRDLKRLSKDSTIIRTHGGCILVGRAALETEYHKNVAHNFYLKQAIGKYAAKIPKKGQVLLINDGSTTYHLASYLGTQGPLTVYTNSIAMISEINRFRDIKLYLLGGEYNPDLYYLSGSLTEQMLDMLNFDIVFLGVDAVDENGRCLVSTPEVARLAKTMLRSASKKVLLADHTKVRAYSYVEYGTLEEFDNWITTPGITNAALKKFKKMTTVLEAEV